MKCDDLYLLIYFLQKSEDQKIFIVNVRRKASKKHYEIILSLDWQTHLLGNSRALKLAALL